MLSFLSPLEVLSNISLTEETEAAEFGCGSGKFALLLAKQLRHGKVYGIDIQNEPLIVLKKQADAKNLFNIETRRGNLEKVGGSGIGDRRLDLVLIPNLLFQVNDKKAVVQEAKRILKDGGKLLIVDWKPEAAILDTSRDDRISSEKIIEIADELDMELVKEFEAGAYHYGLVFKR